MTNNGEHNFGHHKNEEQQQHHCGQNIMTPKPVTSEDDQDSQNNEFKDDLCFHICAELLMPPIDAAERLT
jgi:hypothetical protein